MSSVLKQSHVVYKTQLRERRTRHAAMLAATKPHCKKPIKFKITRHATVRRPAAFQRPSIPYVTMHQFFFFKPLILFSQAVFVQILLPL